MWNKTKRRFVKDVEWSLTICVHTTLMAFFNLHCKFIVDQRSRVNWESNPSFACLLLFISSFLLLSFLHSLLLPPQGVVPSSGNGLFFHLFFDLSSLSETLSTPSLLLCNCFRAASHASIGISSITFLSFHVHFRVGSAVEIFLEELTDRITSSWELVVTTFRVSIIYNLMQLFETFQVKSVSAVLISRIAKEIHVSMITKSATLWVYRNIGCSLIFDLLEFDPWSWEGMRKNSHSFCSTWKS